MDQPLPLDALPGLDNPLLEFLGVRLTQWRDNYAEMRLLLNENLLNRSGVVHGGIICTLLDAVAGYSGLYAQLGEPARHAVTLSLTTNFLGNGVGRELTAKGMAEKKGRSIYFTRSEIWLDDDLLVASAVGTFKYLK
jgi:uncharacterized protein (TIGR00369 family)